MNTIFRKLNFGILSIFFKYFHIIITGKLLQRWFLGNKISKSERDFRNFQKYLSPKISRYTVYYEINHLSESIYRKLRNFHVKIVHVLNIHINLFSWVYGTHENILT